jgi:hypothetical protein
VNGDRFSPALSPSNYLACIISWNVDRDCSFLSRKLVLLELWRKGNRTGRRWKVADAWHWVTKWGEKKKKEEKLDRSKWKCLAFRSTWNLE